MTFAIAFVGGVFLSLSIALNSPPTWLNMLRAICLSLGVVIVAWSLK